MTVPHGLHHRYYARQVGTYGALLSSQSSSSQFPRGHQMGQSVYCLDAAGNPIACGSGEVMATLPALPGGGQNIQTPPPTATSPALPPAPSYTSMFSQALPWLAGGLVLMLVLSPERRGRR